MSHSAQQAVRDAIVAALLAAPALAGGRVVANRRRPMAQAVASQVFVYLADSEASRETLGQIDWHTRVRIECLARDSAGLSAEDAADALAVSAYARIMADTTLGGTAIDADPKAIAWTEDEADTTLSACQQIVSVWHSTPDTSIAA